MVRVKGDQDEALLDAEDHAVYVISNSTTAVPESIATVRHLSCGECRKTVPNWFISYNKYFQLYFKNAPSKTP